MNSFDWLIDFRQRRELKNRDIAEIAGVSAGTVSNWIAFRQVPKAVLKILQDYDTSFATDPHTPPAVLSALSQFDGLALDYSKTIELRLFASLPASTWGEIGETVEMMPVLAYQAKGVDGLIKVKGKCMMPALQDGDYVMIRLADSAEPGQIVIARNGDGEVTLKRLRLANEKLVLSADATPQEAVEASKAQIFAVCVRKYKPPQTEELL